MSYKLFKELLDSYLSEMMDKSNVDLMYKIEKLNNESRSRGTIHGGLYYTEILKLTNEMAIQNCEDTIESIVNLQNELNWKLKKKHVKRLIDILKPRIILFYESLIDNYYFETIQASNLGTNLTNEASINNTKQKIINIIDSKLLQIRNKNYLMKDSSDLFQKKISNAISIIAISISVISLIVSITK